MSRHLDVKPFELENPDLKALYQEDPCDPDWTVAVYFNPKDQKYYARGPFAYHDGVCYIQLSTQNETEVQEFIDTYRNTGKLKW